MTRAGTFRHEALLYAGEDEFLRSTMAFIREAVAAEEPVLVVVGAAKIDALRASLDGEADGVCFADMNVVGTNPARIIPAWRAFVREHSAHGRRLRGIGEPIFPQRSPAELVECHRHESLLNLAFAETSDFWILCPYDTEALDPAVVEAAQNTHPFLTYDGVRRQSDAWQGLEAVVAPFDSPLPEPPAGARELTFDGGHLGALRAFMSELAAAAGLSKVRGGDLALAVSEVAANSVRYGGGGGLLRVWQDPDAVVCEVRDGGRIEHPLVGRERPARDQIGGYGLWLANQLCELVQVRTFPTGSAVRLHMRRA